MTEFSLMADGWLTGVRQLVSPNHDQRPAGSVIDAIIIHAISLPAGVFGTDRVDKLFLNQLDQSADPSFAALAELRVSAHLCIWRNGNVTQYVSLQQRAWHAGVSELYGRKCCNDFSIGIELEGCDAMAYTEQQYNRLQQLLQLLCVAFPAISTERIVGHCHVAPERKTDPGPYFSWQRIGVSNTLVNA